MTDAEARERLAELMEERRLELHLTWREVAEAAGISYEAIRDVRASRTRPIRPLTRRGIDKGLQWLEGCGVDNILAGHLPLPAALGPALPAVEDFAREMGADPDGPIVTDIRQQINRAELAYGANPTGAQVFGTGPVGVVESVIWDDRIASKESKILAIAALRADRARYEAGRHGNGRSGTAGLAPLLTLAGR